MKKDFEIIRYEKMKHLKVFVVEVAYRNFHMHSAMELNFILDGKAVISTTKQSFNVKKGDLLFYNSNEIHEIVSDNIPVRILSLQISRNFCQQYFPLLGNLKLSKTVLANKVLTKLILAIAVEYLSDNLLGDLKLLNLTTQLLYELFSTVSYTTFSGSDLNRDEKKAAKISLITALLNEHHTDKINLAIIAQHLKITPTYLSHFFKDNVGVTIQEYVDKLRFETAVALLISTNLPLIEISTHSGFSDLRYLKSSFIKNVGVSPVEFKENYQPSRYLHAPHSKTSAQFVFDRKESLDIVSGILLG